MQREGVKIVGKIGGNIGEYRGNTGFAYAILRKRNIGISSRVGHIWNYPATEIMRGVSFGNPPADFCISQI